MSTTFYANFIHLGVSAVSTVAHVVVMQQLALKLISSMYLSLMLDSHVVVTVLYLIKSLNLDK